jgi:hypothetical protein
MASKTAIAAINWMTCSLGSLRFRRILSTYRLGSALFLLLLATLGSQLSSLSIVVWAAIACGAQVVFDLAKTRQAAQPKAE